MNLHLDDRTNRVTDRILILAVPRLLNYIVTIYLITIESRGIVRQRQLASDVVF